MLVLSRKNREGVEISVGENRKAVVYVQAISKGRIRCMISADDEVTIVRVDEEGKHQGRRP